ncbi:MAG: Sir2 family NAD-dependent protein deacetylase [Thermoanaerobaculia bacterium]
MSEDGTGALREAVLATETGLLLVVTGAGVSAASGIATFRGPEPEAVWRSSDVSLATEETFRRDPVAQWRWYLERFRTLAGARPNPAHEALVALERWQIERGGRFLLVTQNIDGLHAAAGQRELVEVHGTSARLRCSRDGCTLAAPAGSLPREEVDLTAFEAEPGLETLPVCPECGALLRAHVLFFDELYDGHRDYRFDDVCDAARLAAAILFVGTSFSVGVTDLLLRTGVARRIPLFSIDPVARAAPPGVRRVGCPAEVVLPDLVRRLRDAPLRH